METEISRTYPEPHYPRPCCISHFFKIYLNITLQSTSRSSLFPSGFPTNILYARLFPKTRATFPALLIRLHVIT